MPNANDVAERGSRVPSRASRAVRGALTLAAFFALGGLLSTASVPCAFARLFHVPCPGCGSTRAMLALAHGDLGGVLRLNPLAPLMTACVLVLAVQGVRSTFVEGNLSGMGEGRVGTLAVRGMLVVAVLQLAVWIARFAGFLGGPVPV